MRLKFLLPGVVLILSVLSANGSAQEAPQVQIKFPHVPTYLRYVHYRIGDFKSSFSGQENGYWTNTQKVSIPLAFTGTLSVLFRGPKSESALAEIRFKGGTYKPIGQRKKVRRGHGWEITRQWAAGEYKIRLRSRTKGLIHTVYLEGEAGRKTKPTKRDNFCTILDYIVVQAALDFPREVAIQETKKGFDSMKAVAMDIPGVPISVWNRRARLFLYRGKKPAAASEEFIGMANFVGKCFGGERLARRVDDWGQLHKSEGMNLVTDGVRARRVVFTAKNGDYEIEILERHDQKPTDDSPIQVVMEFRQRSLMIERELKWKRHLEIMSDD